MTEPKLTIARARELLVVSPPAAARARVLGRVLAVRRVTVRKGVRRALVLVTALLVSATAAAVGGSALARWTGWSATGAAPHHSSAGPGGVPQARGPAPLVKAPRGVPEQHTPPLAPASALLSPPSPAATPPGVALRPVVPPPSTPTASTLAQEVAAYREAAALVTTSPGLAIVRLRAHRENFPASALGPEVSLRLVQAFTALGRNADARREAQSFLIRYPRSAKRAEMQAIVDGAAADGTQQ